MCVLTKRIHTVTKVVLSHVLLSHQINFMIIKIFKRHHFTFFPLLIKTAFCDDRVTMVTGNHDKLSLLTDN